MKLPWKRGAEAPPVGQFEHDEHGESQEAVREAAARLNETIDRGEVVRDVSERLRAIRQRNHFGEMLTRVMREGR